MKLLSFKSTSDHLLLCIFFSLLWVLADCNTTIQQGTRNKADSTVVVTTPLPTTTTTTTTTTPPPPPNVGNVTVVTQNESSITLHWNKVDGIPTYELKFEGGELINVTSISRETVVLVISDLDPGRKYSFTLFTARDGLKSSGFQFTGVTAPPDTGSFQHIYQTESSITLQWTKVENIDNYTLSYKDTEVNITHSEQGGTYTVPDLTSATRYSFTLCTVFENVRSRGTTITAVTAPSDSGSFQHITQTESSITLQWTKVEKIDNYTLSYKDTEVNITHSEGGGTYTVYGLTSATRYSFTLFTVFENVRSRGTTITAVTAPSDSGSFQHIYQTENSITLQWTKVENIDNYTLSYKDTEVNITHSEGGGTYTVYGLTSATRYSFTLFTVFENVRSNGTTITAVTAPWNAERFERITENESSITLQWTNVEKIDNYTLSYNKNEVNITHYEGDGNYTVSGLTSATIYSFTLFTVFDYARSRGTTITAVTAPENPAEFISAGQNETSITLQWKPVRDVQEYIVSFSDIDINITASNETVTHIIPHLESGTSYDFRILSVFDYARSSGANLTAHTVPPEVPSVNVTERSVDRVTLQWEDPNKGWKYQLNVDDRELEIIENNLVSYSVINLKPGTMYSFNVTTHFSGLKSTPHTGVTVTKINCSSVSWLVTNSSIQGTVEGLFSTATASNGSEAHVSPEGKTVSFSGLYPGATYNISLQYELFSTLLPQCSIKIPIIPPSLTAHCSYWSSGYGALIEWDTPDGVWTAGEVSMNGKTHPLDLEKNKLIVTGLQPAKRYQVSVISKLQTKFGNRDSEPSFFFCSTDNRGVIAGSLFGVLLFAVLICVIAFIVLRRPDLIRKKSFLSGSKKFDSKRKTIPAAKFPDHFHQLSLDENRGFSQEYESLVPVGMDQPHKAATLLESNGKNRFTNILPYDWSRVKLSTSSPNNTLDYINANYLPGYNSSKEYIATQGPLPSTVNDFWRMVWEQKVKRIVMVTNCLEAGRTKCEQYWPEDGEPCHYGELVVSKTSEDKESSWTLREFRVKHKNDSEERRVKHFHFTAWPDHGVPQGTEVLIHFRGLMRQHIESEGSKAPTVVHCSAGVGRTGTIIALDVLLQQLEREQAVGINDFVHKMRNHRSHMVQTEISGSGLPKQKLGLAKLYINYWQSQYVFLHQCIMDSLQPPAPQEENIYENDLIYVNATALRQLR